MPRTWLMLLALFAVGYLGFFGYSYLTRTQPEPESKNSTSYFENASGVSAIAAAPDAVQRAVADTHDEAAEAKNFPQDIVAKWADEGTDAKARAAEIAALATAPKAQAVPVLQRVLSAGAEEDRQLALNSLRTLAQQQGDADGNIRNALRQAIYHGDNEAVASSAQTILSDVERDLNLTAPKTKS